MSPFRNRQLFVLSLGHFGVDMYSNFLPMLYPLLVATLGLSYTMVGGLQLIYSGVSSLTQPFFGYLADRYGGRYFAAGGVLASCLFTGLIGYVTSYNMLLVVLTLCALAGAAFHPQGAMNASVIVERNRRASAMSVFMFGGNVGFAVGPVLAAAVLASPWGLSTTALIPIPGLIIALWLVRLMAKVDQAKRASVSEAKAALPPAVAQTRAGHRHVILAVTAVVFVVMLRSWSYLSLSNFLPLYYHDLELPTDLARNVLFVMLMGSAVGGIVGGYLADRLGRRRVIAISLLVAAPAVYLFLAGAGFWLFPIGAFVGLIFGSSYSVTLVMAQDLLPRSMGVASGLIMGLAFVTGGIGVAVTGWLADQYTLSAAMQTLIVLPLLAFVICIFLPVQRQAAPSPVVAAKGAVAE